MRAVADDARPSYLARRLSRKARLTLLTVQSVAVLVVLGWDLATTLPADVQTRACVLAVVGFVVSIAGSIWLVRHSRGVEVSEEDRLRFEGRVDTVRVARGSLILVAFVLYLAAIAWRANAQDLAALILGLLLGVQIQGLVRLAAGGRSR
jgi:hypothetical protein